MRREGWSGDPPGDDEEAVRRILAAARTCMDRSGASTGIADVARELGVTRQTVYRYFRTSHDLLTATALDASVGFLGRIERHLAKRPGTPAEVMVEAIAYTLEQVPAEPYLGLLMTPGRVGLFSQGVTSPAAIAMGRTLIDRFPIDWRAHGVDGDELDELVELLLRMVQSFSLDPGTPPRTGAELRRYLTRWLAPAMGATVSG